MLTIFLMTTNFVPEHSKQNWPTYLGFSRKRSRWSARRLQTKKENRSNNMTVAIYWTARIVVVVVRCAVTQRTIFQSNLNQRKDEKRR